MSVAGRQHVYGPVPSRRLGRSLGVDLVPFKTCTYDCMVEGLVTFRERFAKLVWLEVMLLAGVTGIRSEIEKIAALTRRIRPDRVQLNTVTRPPCEECACPLPPESMASFARLFGRAAGVVSGRRPRRSPAPAAGVVTDADILALLTRRPCTARGISEGLGMHMEFWVLVRDGTRVDAQSPDSPEADAARPVAPRHGVGSIQ